ncbi:MAG TPA: SdrD B-like domain-containing protein [Methylomirabilota bacterium]|nr:SdrD B-like domain-containing protein [Methylomirabilota bacterium]
MEKTVRKNFFSKISLVGLLSGLVLFLLIPLLVLLLQQKQNFQTKAAESTSNTLSPGLGFISGYVYHDDNKDGQRESEEKPFANVVINIKQIKDNDTEGGISNMKTDSYGYFRFRFSLTSSSRSSYVVKLIIPSGYKTVDTNPVVIADSTLTTQKLIEFGLFPPKSLPTLSPTIPLLHKTSSRAALPHLTPIPTH